MQRSDPPSGPVASRAERGRVVIVDDEAPLRRALLRILEQKGHIRHEEDGPRYVFLPSVPRQKARVAALRHVLKTFFDGSAAEAAAALVDGSTAQMSTEELDRLEALIERARKEKRD